MLQVKNHNPFQLRPLAEIDSPEKTLFKGIKHLKGYEWWVSVGTAIGFYRDGDFIPNDTDIDVGVRAQKGIVPPEVPDMTLIRETFYGDRITQRAYIDDNKCIFDIFFYYDDVEDGRLITWSEGGKISKPNFGVKELDTKYGKLPFLHPIEEYLEDRYGDWTVKESKKGRYEMDNS